MKITGAPIPSGSKDHVEANLRLCLWLLDQCRMHLPKSHYELSYDIREIERKLNDGSAHNYPNHVSSSRRKPRL